MSLKQALLKKYFKRDDGGDSESQGNSDEESIYLPSKSKRLFSEPKSWTRVRNLSKALDQRVTIFDVEKDLKSDKALKQIRKDVSREPKPFVFDPESFRDSDVELTLSRQSLSREQLLEYARVASKVRRSISQQVEVIRASLPPQKSPTVTELVSDSLTNELALRNSDPVDYSSKDDLALRKMKRRKLRDLSAAERL